MALSHTNPSIYLAFLRPLALPRASTLCRFLSTSASSSTSTTSSSQQFQSAAPGPVPAPESLQPGQPALLPYRINRTPSSKLPIYLLAKRGGNLKQTKLRKIEGDINVLREQLRDALKLEEKEIVINQLTRQIIIRGWRKPEVAKFLEERQF